MVFVCLGFCCYCCCVLGGFVVGFVVYFFNKALVEELQVCGNTGTQKHPEDAPWAATLFPSLRFPSFPAAQTHQSPPSSDPAFAVLHQRKSPQPPPCPPTPDSGSRSLRVTPAGGSERGGRRRDPPVTPFSPRSSPGLSADPPALPAAPQPGAVRARGADRRSPPRPRTPRRPAPAPAPLRAPGSRMAAEPRGWRPERRRGRLRR